jgi:hypothetical protein
MASHSTPRIVALLAGGTISKGMAVKKGSSDEYVVAGSANTSKCVGIAQCDATSGQVVEVALPGGGAKALLSETVAMGNILVSHTDGSLVLANASGDRIIATAMKDGVSGDLIDVEVMVGVATAAES